MTIQYFNFPEFDHDPTPDELCRVYEDGFPGAPTDTESRDELFGSGVVEMFEDACPHLRGLHKRDDRQVVPLFLAREQLDPGAFGLEAQTTGDCVSHGCRSARDVTRSVQIVIEGKAEKYRARGATEPTYGARGHGGSGMNPALATRFVHDWGFLLRENYPEISLDLSQYNARIGMNWGRRGVPAAVRERARELGNVGRWIAPRTGDEALDLLAAGYACHSGQNIGFNRQPDSRGVHRVRGRWNHDMATVGYDLSRDVWPDQVVFVPNSWGAFNTQPARHFQERNWPIIRGMIVVRLEDWIRYFVGSRSIYFYADVRGVPAKTLEWTAGKYL